MMEIAINTFNVISAVVTIASVIIKLTPSQKDDAIFSKYVMPIFNALALTPKKK